MTRKKTHICKSGAYQQQLCEIVGAEFLPVEYGGTNQTPLGESAEEKAMATYVQELNDGKFDDPDQASA